jgi:hypothetical protein
MLNALWWGGGSYNERGIHWLAWEKLACPKANGGLDIRNFEAFNITMVAKQTWNIVQNPDSLVAKVIKARYFPRSSLFEASEVIIRALLGVVFGKFVKFDWLNVGEYSWWW